jgi:lysophospholipase L1-like esterase
MTLKYVVISLLLLILVIAATVWNYDQKKAELPIDTTIQDGVVSYIPIGDSYTIGNGLKEADRWPNVMTKRLNDAGIPVRLVANPAVSGFTVQDALVREIPVIEKLKPDFVTLFIGANDNFGGISASEYESELKNLLDALQSKMENPKNIVMITIPDYSKTPAAVKYETRGVPESIAEYNEVIKKEAAQRGLKVADIFPVSQTMTEKADYISDGLHPSAQGTAKWEQVIYPVVLEKLQENW